MMVELKRSPPIMLRQKKLKTKQVGLQFTTDAKILSNSRDMFQVLWDSFGI